MPHGHTARGCFNCKHHTAKVKCAKDKGTVWNGYEVTCIAYVDHEHAARNLVKLERVNPPEAAKLWQAQWEWNGEF